jgi:hypothetical protein
VKLIAPLALSLTLLAGNGCGLFKQQESSKAKAEIGLPRNLNITYDDGSQSGNGLTIWQVKQADGTLLRRHSKGNPLNSFSVTFLKDPSASNLLDPSNVFGTPLVKKDDEFAAMIANTPWLCVDVEELFLGKAVSLIADKQLCLISMHTTGKIGEGAVSIIGLNAKEGDADAISKGLKEYTLDSASLATKESLDKSAKDGLAAGKGVDLEKGLGMNPNNSVDSNTLAAALLEVHTAFKASVSDEYRNTCLKNFRTAESGWTDSAVHYWCQFPLADRECYVPVLVAGKKKSDEDNAGKTLPKMINVLGAKKLHNAAFEACKGSPRATALAAIERDPKMKGKFMTIMTQVQTLSDFNVTMEQEAISKFYKDAGYAERPRRINDTYPQWLAEQPRYVHLRAAQLKTLSELPTLLTELQAFLAAAQAAAQAGAAGGTVNPSGLPVNPPALGIRPPAP